MPLPPPLLLLLPSPFIALAITVALLLLGCVVIGFLPCPETASVGELSTCSNVGIFLKVLRAGVFFEFFRNRIELFSQLNYFSQIW
jgi:hypothetical protein